MIMVVLRRFILRRYQDNAVEFSIGEAVKVNKSRSSHHDMFFWFEKSLRWNQDYG
jgi:hypothetical protein